MTGIVTAAIILIPLLVLFVFLFNNPKRRSAKISSYIFLALVFVFLYIPIVVLIVFSFNSSRSGGVWTGFSLKWYAELIKDDSIMKALWNTVLIAFVSSVLSAIMGSFASIGIFYMRKLPKSLIMNLTYIPVLNADIITGISLLLLFNIIHIPLGYVSVIIAHICFNVPYVILSVMPKLQQMDNNLYEAALDLGSTPMTAIRKVIFPEIMPGVISGFLLALTMSVDDFVITFFTSGPLVSTLSIEIYSMTKRGVSPKINALSTILFVTVLAVLIIINIRNGKMRTKGESTVK